MEILKERRDRVKIRKRTKAQAASTASAIVDVNLEVPLAPPVDEVTLEDEDVIRERERSQLAALINPEVKEDFGASSTGLYDLVGAQLHIFIHPTGC